jgi:D-serine deaminase-like pyridoxal phosphate-dependent protein
MRIAELDTPALLIDLDLMEANIAALMARLRPSGVRVRPHLKTAKTPRSPISSLRRGRTASAWPSWARPR